MAALNTSQRAPLNVETSSGVAVAPPDRTTTVTPSGIVHVEMVGLGGGATDYVVADAPGTAIIHVAFAGQEGELEVTVSAAPLVVTLGTPVPK